MARSRFIYTLKDVVSMIGENLELLEEVTANSDNIAEGELVMCAMALKMARKV